jgi:hypothetical protein
MPWRELSVQSHERDDGAAVQHAALHDQPAGGFPWMAFGPRPDRAPLTDPGGRTRRFRTAQGAMAAAQKAWPAKRG